MIDIDVLVERGGKKLHLEGFEIGPRPLENKACIVCGEPSSDKLKVRKKYLKVHGVKSYSEESTRLPAHRTARYFRIEFDAMVHGVCSEACEAMTKLDEDSFVTLEQFEECTRNVSTENSEALTNVLTEGFEKHFQPFQ